MADRGFKFPGSSSGFVVVLLVCGEALGLPKLCTRLAAAIPSAADFPSRHATKSAFFSAVSGSLRPREASSHSATIAGVMPALRAPSEWKNLRCASLLYGNEKPS